MIYMIFQLIKFEKFWTKKILESLKFFEFNFKLL